LPDTFPGTKYRTTRNSEELWEKTNYDLGSALAAASCYKPNKYSIK
jgi:hypothetical protein